MDFDEDDVIFIDENIPLLPAALAGCGKVVKFKGRTLENEELVKKNCHSLFIRSTTKVDKDLLHYSQVRFVATATSGVDHIDEEYLDKKNVTFVAAPGSNANSVAEYVFYAALKWAKSKGERLRGKTIGVVGFGNIGKIVAKYANYFGMIVLVNDPPLRDEGFEFPEYCVYSDLREMFARCDVVTNHVPLTKSGDYPTLNLINEDLIALLKNGALIISASRGGVVDEETLKERLRNGEISAATDVFKGEPLVDVDLARLSILASPHVAGYSRDGKLRGARMIAEAYRAFSGNKPALEFIDDELSHYEPATAEDFRDEDKIFDILKENRKFEEDTEKFLETLDLPDERRAIEFDRLRKQYPKRRESL